MIVTSERTTTVSLPRNAQHARAPMQHSTPVVVLNWSRQGGLGIVRSLGRLGIPVFGINSKPLAPASFSRYLERRFEWDFDLHSPAESLEFVCGVAKRIGGKPILIAARDEEAMFVSEYSVPLREHFIFPAMPPGLSSALCSKREMYWLAKRYSIPTAQCVFPSCRQDVVGYTKSGVFPVMLKGIDGQRLQKVSGKKMFVVRTARQLLEYYDRFEDSGSPNIMLQEYIPGGDDTVWMFNGYFNENSECLFGITGQKIHQYPIHTGLTSLGVCRRNQEVFDQTNAFMSGIGYSGILDIGFRYDARDGTYKVLDVNPRIGASFRLFVTRSGMDVARALYFDLTGQPLEAGPVQEGRKWIVEDIDFISSVRYLVERKLPIGELCRSYRGIDETAFFAWDDPLPFLMMFVGAGIKAINR